MLQRPIFSDIVGSVWLGMFVSLWSATCCEDQYSQTVGSVWLGMFVSLWSATCHEHQYSQKVLVQSCWVCLFHYGQPHAMKTNILSVGSVWLGMFVSLWSATCHEDQYSQKVLGQSGWICLFRYGQPHAVNTNVLRQCWVNLAGYVCFTVVSYVLQRSVFSDSVGSVWLGMFVSLWSAACCKDQYSQTMLGQSGCSHILNGSIWLIALI